MFLDSGSVEEEVEIFRENIKEKIFLKISIIKSDEGQLEGYVFTFDDLTDLVAAQRSAAWGHAGFRDGGGAGATRTRPPRSAVALGTGCAATRWAQGVPPEALCGVPPVDTEALQMPVVPPKRRWAQGDTNHADWHSISS